MGKEIDFLGSLYGHGTGFAGCVFGTDGLSPTLQTGQGGSREPIIPEIEITKISTNGTETMGTIVAGLEKMGGATVMRNAAKNIGGEPVREGYEGIVEIEKQRINTNGTEYAQCLTAQSYGGSESNLLKNANYYLNKDYSKQSGCQGVFEVDKMCCAMRGRNPENPSDRTIGAPTEQRLELNEKEICNTLTSVQKDNLVIETVPLRMARTEEGKKIRKQYENHEIEHGFNEFRQLEPRTDGVTNTLTSVQKDNLVLQIKANTKDGYTNMTLPGLVDCTYPDSETRRGRVQGDGQICPTLTTQEPEIYYVELAPPDEYTSAFTDGESIFHIRLRKLTPRECWRLMGFPDEAFDKASQVNSNTQLYKQAGNSIVVNVLMAIFDQMNLMEV